MSVAYGQFIPPPGLYGHYAPGPQASMAQLQNSAVTTAIAPTGVTAMMAGQMPVIPGQMLGGSMPVQQVAPTSLMAMGTPGLVQGNIVSFDGLKDCKELNKAIVGAGTDEDALIRILAHRPKEHIDLLIHLYTRRFKASLYSHVKHDTSHNFKKTLLHLLQPYEEIKAKRLYKAMKGIGTKDKSIIDVLAYASNDEIRRIKYEYQSYYGKAGDVGDALIRDIKDDTSGMFERCLTTLLKAERNEEFFINEQKVKDDCHNLYTKGEGRLGTDDTFFVELFCQRSPWHIAALNQEYKKEKGKELIEVIKAETSGDFRDILCALVTPKAVWYADRLEYSMKGLGTHDSLLIFILTSTTEIERMAIRTKYEEKYKKALKDVIRGDTSGSYRDLLISLVSFTGDVDSAKNAVKKQ